MKNAILFLLITSVFIVPGFTEDAITMYEEAQELYRDDRTEEALNMFLDFRESAAGSNKLDDALWYIGRLYRRQGRFTDAEQAFITVLNDDESNRRTEAFYDLVKLYDERNTEEKIIFLTALVFPEQKLDSYFIKSLPVLLKSYSIAGLHFRREHLGLQAAQLWNDGLEIISLYDDDVLDPDIRGSLDRYRISLQLNILEITADDDTRRNITENLLSLLDQYDSEYTDEADRVIAWRAELSAIDKPPGHFDYSAEITGGYNGLFAQPGLYGKLSLGGTHPWSSAGSFSWDIGYKHDSFVFKTFNFNPAKTGTAQYFQWKEKIDASIGFSLGNPYLSYQDWTLAADLTLAEDPGDFSYGVDLSGDFMFPLMQDNYIEWGNNFRLSMFPEYVNGTNELNYFSADTNPVWFLVFSPGQILSAGYEAKYKYYLNAYYDTAAGGTDTVPRQYLINKLLLNFDSSPVSDLRIESGYELEYLKSFHYDMWIYGNPADLFITDYFDYLKNTLYLKAVLSPGDYTGDIKVEASVRNFLNYEARDETRTFTGEKRVDLGLVLSSGHRYKFLDTESAGKFYALLQFDWELSVSNHTYETTYITNFSNWQLLLGILWKD